MTSPALRLPLWIRLWHWLTALLFITLTVTGVLLHFATPGFTAATYQVATTLHDVGGIALSVLYVIYLILVFGTGYWRQYIPVRRGLWQRARAQVIFYLIAADQEGSSDAVPSGKTRFNALQQLTYLIVVFGLLPLLVITGLLYLYYPAVVPGVALGLDGLWPFALGHYALAVMGTAYLIVHVYMATVGPMAGSSFRLITVGRTGPAAKR